MKLEIVAELIHNSGLATKGSSLFIGHMPEKAVSGVLLLDPQIGEKIDEELPQYRKTRFQVIVRNASRIEGETLASLLMEVLTIYEQKLSSGDFIKKMRPRHEPVTYPFSDGDYLETSVNYDVVYIRT